MKAVNGGRYGAVNRGRYAAGVVDGGRLIKGGILASLLCEL